MVRFIASITCLFVLAAFAAGMPAVDTTSHEQTTEWQIFSVNEPVSTFALQENVIWCVTASGVASVAVRSADMKNLTALGSMSVDGITCVAADDKQVWFGGPNGAAMKRGAKWTVFTAENGLSGSTVNAIAIDAGTVWIGTDKGLDRYADGSWKSYTKEDGLVSNMVKALAVDEKGGVWIGTNRGISVLSNGGFTSHTMKSGLSWNDVHAIGIAPREGTVWAAVGEKDVNAFDGKEWNVYMSVSPGIRSIMVDTQGRVWLGSQTGLIKFNGDEWITDPAKHGVPAQQVTWTHLDDGGNLWFATENGVLRLANPYPF